MTKKTIYLDFDGVVVDTKKAFVDYYNNHYNDHPEYAFADHTKCNMWNYYDICPLAANDVESIFGEKEVFDRLEFFEDAEKFIKKLNKKFNIIIVSLGTYDNIHHKSKWIKDNMPFIHESVLLAKGTGEMMDKSVVNMIDGIFIDDVSKNLFSTNARLKINYGPEYKWNEDWSGLRIDGWDKMYTFLIENEL